MSHTFNIEAVVRNDGGKGASRRLRREGLVPGIIYGGGKDPEMIATAHNKLLQHLENEAFYSSIVNVEVDGNTQRVVLKDLQRHPAKPFIIHFDLQRVAATDRIKMHVPLHFIGEDEAPGIKAGGNVSHALVDLEIICEAQNLPEYIEVDVSGMEVGDMLHLTDLNLPEGVEILALTHGDEHEHDELVVAMQAKSKAAEEEEISNEAESTEEPSSEGE
ncbi:MAG TPA: 50S ribosomal protein L25/general stress protein Ctc [Thiolapillus brandeum]|uniref:Large ribosomal subunit protein bL25 n=1 Tax=Thiolapillus brandeum TaxID=1076588 RepID=A0A831NSH9_9GAMM|nr:50S ribosomal protein L25/general stress protein Ctc [Thiolapillus brandeum]